MPSVHYESNHAGDSAKMTGGDAITAGLLTHDIDSVFGLPGARSMGFSIRSTARSVHLRRWRLSVLRSGIGHRGAVWHSFDHYFAQQQCLRQCRTRSADGLRRARDCSELKNPDFVKWGEAYGVPRARVRSPLELRALLEKALGDSQPWLIEVPVRPKDEASPWPWIMP